MLRHLIFGYIAGTVFSLSFHYLINMSSESLLFLVLFNFLFISALFPLNGSLRIKMGVLLIGNFLNLLWNTLLYLFTFSAAEHFGSIFNTLYIILSPLLNLLWIVSFCSLSLTLLSHSKGKVVGVKMLADFLEAVFLFLTSLMVAYLVRHYIFTLSLLKNIQKGKPKATVESEGYMPTVSILIPARNEERVIGRLLQRMTELTYPKEKLQVVVIDDASEDNTGKIVEEYSKNYGYITVAKRSRNEGGRGKASALNAGMQHAKCEVILCFDADYYPQRDIVEKLVREFEDPKVGAVQGRVVVLNEPQNIVTRLVALERIGGYRVDQKARDQLGLVTQFGGTVGGFRRSLLESLGGWDENILAEDTDLTFRVYLAGYRVKYVADAECYEEAVESWRAYWKQRYRWAKGHMQCFFKHATSVLKSKNLGFFEKIDGSMLLNVYFVPILILSSWIVGVPLFFLKFSQWFPALWTVMVISLYSSVGNFAPFYEVAVGVYIDGRTRTQWLIPLLILNFLYNIPICTKALLDLLASKLRGKTKHRWDKTLHTGNGNRYIGKHVKI